MKRIIVSTLVCLGLFWPLIPRAYWPGTHQLLTGIALGNSVLVQKLSSTDSTVLDDLGLKGYTDPTQLFPDVQAGENVKLGPAGPKFVAKSPLDIRDLVMTGAAIEDEGTRSFCHFFDPINGHAHPLNFTLGGAFVEASYDDPDWATGAATGPCTLEGVIGNEDQTFSIQDAEAYYYNALTKPNKAERSLNFGITCSCQSATFCTCLKILPSRNMCVTTCIVTRNLAS